MRNLTLPFIIFLSICVFAQTISRGRITNNTILSSVFFVSVVDKGADSTGVVSSSQAFQDAFDTARDSSYAGVVVPPGSYDVINVRIYAGQTLIINDALLTFAGTNPSPLSRLDPVNAMFHIYGATSTTPAKKIRIYGGFFDGGRSGWIESSTGNPADMFNLWNVQQVEFHNVEIKDAQRAGIIVRNSSNISITNSVIRDCAGPGILIYGGSNFVVDADSFYQVSSAVRAHPDTANSTITRLLSFTNNDVQAFKEGMLIALPTDLNISNNHFEPLTVTGFSGDSTSAVRIVTHINTGELPSTPYEVRNVLIKNNSIVSYNIQSTSTPGTHAALYLDETTTQTIGENIKIENNYIDDCEMPNIWAEFDVDIIHNDINSVSTGTSTKIIYLDITHASDIKKSSNISGNRIFGVTSGTDGINLAGTSYFRVINNFLFNCDIAWLPSSGYEGTISNNHIQDGQISLSGDLGVISGNIIQTVIAAAGIDVLSGASGNIISGNYVTMSVSFPNVHLQQGSTANNVIGNVLEDGSYGVYIDHSDNHVIHGNIITGALSYAIYRHSSGGTNSDGTRTGYNFLEGAVAGFFETGSGANNIDTLNVVLP